MPKTSPPERKNTYQTYIPTHLPTYLPPLENTLKERSQSLVTFQNFDQSGTPIPIHTNRPEAYLVYASSKLCELICVKVDSCFCLTHLYSVEVVAWLGGHLDFEKFFPSLLLPPSWLRRRRSPTLVSTLPSSSSRSSLHRSTSLNHSSSRCQQVSGLLIWKENIFFSKVRAAIISTAADRWS